MLRRRALVLLTLAAAVLAGLAPAGRVHAEEGDDGDPYGDVIAEFRRKVRTPNVEKAMAAVRLLDPANPRSLPELMDVLTANHWMVRGRAMEALSEIPAGPLRAEMRLHLITHEKLWVREGIAYAMALDAQEGDADALVGAMDDTEWRVRRTIARALGEIVSRDGAARLVRALEEEDDLRVVIWVRKSLRGIAGTDMGRDPAAWRAWFERHKDRPEWKKKGEEVKRRDFDGIPLETVTIEAPPTSEADRKRRAKLPDLFVLAPFGYDHGWFRPYLDEAAQFLRIHYVKLPTVEELTGKSGYGRDLPRYPVNRLAKALNALRKRMGREKIVILGAGAVGWIAETFALKYPKHTAGLVLVNGWLDSQSYGRALTRLSARGTPAERWVADLLLHKIEPLGTPAQGQRVRGDRFEQHEARLSKQETTQLNNLVRREKVTLNTLVQGAWALLMSRYNESGDVCFGTLVSQRTTPQRVTSRERVVVQVTVNNGCT